MRLLSLVIATMLFPSAAIAANLGETEICKAAIGTIMGRKPSIIKSYKSYDGIQYLSYIRDDGTLWEYKCKLSGDEVIWASSTGRWRTDTLDEKVLYRISSDRSQITITQKYTDGSESTDKYSVNDF